MSQPSRPQAHGPAQRRRRQLKFEAVQPLEDRCLLAPVVAISPTLAAATAVAGHAGEHQLDQRDRDDRARPTPGS